MNLSSLKDARLMKGGSAPEISHNFNKGAEPPSTKPLTFCIVPCYQKFILLRKLQILCLPIVLHIVTELWVPCFYYYCTFSSSWNIGKSCLFLFVF